MHLTVYGIPTCGSVKKAQQWLTQQGYAFTFVNFKVTPPTEADLDRWLATGLDPLKLVNKSSAAWRGLSDAQKTSVDEGIPAIKALLLATPNLIKRPVIEWDDGTLTVGYFPETWPQP